MSPPTRPSRFPIGQLIEPIGSLLCEDTEGSLSEKVSDDANGIVQRQIGLGIRASIRAGAAIQSASHNGSHFVPS